MRVCFIARSSNGRTTVSGTVYLGSNPSLAAVINRAFSPTCNNFTIYCIKALV